MSKLPLGVLGFGKLGELHARNIVSSPNAELVAVCDPDLEAWQRAERYGIQATADLDRFLASSIEGVIIATNTHLHLEHIRAVARAGKAIYTEKPVGLTLADTDLALQEVVNSGVPFQIGFQRRWDSRYLQARSVIEHGDIGDPVLFKAYGRDPNASDPAKWGLGKNGGIFLNCAIHDFDAARYLLGQEVNKVVAIGDTLVHKELWEFDDYDTAATSLFFDGGAMAITEWSRYAAYGYDVGMEVVGTRGTVRFGSRAGSGLFVSPATHRTSVFDVFEDAFRSSIEQFAYAVTTGTPTSPGVEDARVSLQVALAARTSAGMTGLPIHVPPLAPLVRY